MVQFWFVSRLTKDQVQKFLEDTICCTKVRMLELNDITSDILKHKYRYTNGSTEVQCTSFFYTISGNERFIRMTDYHATIISPEGWAWVEESNWRHFLYSIFGEEYELFWLNYKSEERKDMQKAFRQRLKQFDANVKLEQEKMKRT